MQFSYSTHIELLHKGIPRGGKKTLNIAFNKIEDDSPNIITPNMYNIWINYYYLQYTKSFFKKQFLENYLSFFFFLMFGSELMTIK